MERMRAAHAEELRQVESEAAAKSAAAKKAVADAKSKQKGELSVGDATGHNCYVRRCNEKSSTRAQKGKSNRRISHGAARRKYEYAVPAT